MSSELIKDSWAGHKTKISILFLTSEKSGRRLLQLSEGKTNLDGEELDCVSRASNEKTKSASGSKRPCTSSPTAATAFGHTLSSSATTVTTHTTSKPLKTTRMKLLPLELGLSLLLLLDCAAAQPIRRVDPSLPCTGDLSKLNVNGLPPTIAYNALQDPCVPGIANLPPQTCRCTLMAYNLKMASDMCQSGSLTVPQSWSEWVANNNCSPAAESSPPSSINYIATATLPKYAYNTIANGQFDVATALQSNSAWTPIQIVTPIIVGVVVAIIAGVLFLIYRRRKEEPPRRVQKSWENANLRGPRRYWGLFPDRSTVRSMTQRSPQWEIDDPTTQRRDVDEEGRPHTRYSSHSRGESTSSLLSTLRSHTSPQSPQRSLLASIADRISLSKYYQNGTTKGPDYKRVNVRPQHADSGFKIDDSLPTPPIQKQMPERSLPSIPEPPRPDRATSLPSVLDIRRPSTAQAIPSSLRHDSSDTHYAPPTVIHSDFSLGTTDLLTPTTPSSSVRPNVPHPGSPLLPANRMPVFQSPLVHSPTQRRASMDSPTDSLAYELYPRNPPLF